MKLNDTYLKLFPGYPDAVSLQQASEMLNLNRHTVMLMMLYNPGTRLGLMQEFRLMQCYLLPDETALHELSECVIEKLKLMTDAEFSETEFPLE